MMAVTVRCEPARCARRGRPRGPPARVVDLGEVLGGHVLVERAQVDLLLEVAAERHALLLADDGHDGRVVELRVVEPVEQVDGAGAGGRHADADLARELGVRAAANAASSSWRTWTNSSSSPTSWKARFIPLMPSPG